MHSRDNVLEILKNVIIGLKTEDSEMFAGYLRGVGFAIELLEEECKYSKE